MSKKNRWVEATVCSVTAEAWLSPVGVHLSRLMGVTAVQINAALGWALFCAKASATTQN